MNNSKLSVFDVKSTSISGPFRKVNILRPKAKTVQIRMHRYAMVGPGNKLYIDPNHAGSVYVLSESLDDRIKVVPHFEKIEQFKFGNASYQLLIKEITSSSEFDDYEYLETFHYKGSTSNISEETDDDEGKKQKQIGGRKAVLVCYLKNGAGWLVAGYIELQMPLQMVKPRHVLFENKYEHPHRPVKWNSWNLESKKKYVNLIVRIARIVVSPDLRGLGLSRYLIKAAREYSKERWHIKGQRPLFMEISAEMLKYLDFVTTAGLRYVGNTEGNLTRVHKDLSFMEKGLVDGTRGYSISTGIMTLQNKYLTQLKELSQRLGSDFKTELDKLKKLTSSGNEEDLRKELNGLNPAEWFLFKKVLRFPIPYFICGLDEYSQEYIDRNIVASSSHKTHTTINRNNVRLNIENIVINSRYKIPDTVYVRSIRECFGIENVFINSKLVGPISVEASGGNVILITGPSGSGKSLLLKALDPKYESTTLSIKITDRSNKAHSVAWLKEITSDKPLIEYFSKKWGIEESISALNQAGLSEAFIYLKPYKLLSRGQRYRARLAELNLGEQPIWLIDEFCADLDPFTAKIVANNLRKHVIKYGRIAIVAAANYSHFIDELKPTRIMILRQNANSRIMTYKEYVDEFYR